MISLALALRLRAAGLRWRPAPGDRFVLPHRDMDDEVFVLADLTVDVHEFPSGRVLGFNGTTEWALDSVEAEEALWLPRETQLRERLGGTFVRLERHDGTHRVVIRDPAAAGRELTSEHEDVEQAYGEALLRLITG